MSENVITAVKQVRNLIAYTEKPIKFSRHSLDHVCVHRVFFSLASPRVSSYAHVNLKSRIERAVTLELHIWILQNSDSLSKKRYHFNSKCHDKRCINMLAPQLILNAMVVSVQFIMRNYWRSIVIGRSGKRTFGKTFSKAKFNDTWFRFWSPCCVQQPITALLVHFWHRKCSPQLLRMYSDAVDYYDTSYCIFREIFWKTDKIKWKTLISTFEWFEHGKKENRVWVSVYATYVYLFYVH